MHIMGWFLSLAALCVTWLMFDFVASNRARLDYALRFGADSDTPCPALGRTKTQQFFQRMAERRRKRRSPRYEFRAA